MDSPSSVATLKSRLELGHMVRRPSAPPVGLQTEDSENQPRKKPPPPPPPSAPPRKPSAFSPPIEPQSPGDAALKLEERNYGRMDDQEQHHHHSVPPSSPPPYAPPLPTRQNSNNFTTRQTTAPPPPPQLPPRLPPRPPPRPKPESFAHSLIKKKPTAPPPKPAGQGRSLPPPVIPPPVPKGTWGTPKEEARRPSIGPSRPIQPPARPGTTETPSPPSLLPPPPPPPPTSRPSLPPRKSLPSLRPLPTATLPIPPLPKRVLSQPQIEPVHVHQTEEPVAAPLPHRRNILSMGFGGQHGKLPSPPQTPQPETRPPPVPIGSRPVASAPTINTGTKPGLPPLPAARPGTSVPSNHQNINTTCLKCRDFSHVDAHAAKFPRHAYDDVQRLALDLTRNFGSDTDKARVLFTWLHHNVVYDVDAFFNNAVQPSTPASTLRTGLAVCEGFAGLFAAMAMYSGLEAIVIGGHGKGYGWDGPDAKTIPSSPGGHAWNAVRIDNGVWQTIDPCWGAGYLCGAEYKQVFSPHHFTNTNEEFRKSHFPENPDQQFCAKLITFREYWLMEEGPKLYATFSEPDFDYGRDSVEPGMKTLQPHMRYRFRIAGPCEHKPATNNWILLINNGRKEEEQVMMPDGRGGFVADLTTGGSGSAVNLSVLTVFNDQSAKGRLTIDQWKNKRGANSWATSWLCKWDIA
ncbi:hypothetical protein TWF192_009968 [Orbilia oligospora]|uniref:Transglutaminase-like domain-containing protein n=1 Tax=Orbilia oligospora TaxID=2813651 RepID=A0A6G1LZB8_ORBOL|nr:hypothetical protein TWF191_000462 [Orbilia oligospora]KAF3239735.1 hypothetical protein TWF192_009968 [Orbilia oligospora]